MNILAELRQRFLEALEPLVDDPGRLLEMILPVQDPRLGDYQANCAMPLGRRLERTPSEIARDLVKQVELNDICDPPTVAGPGFINLHFIPNEKFSKAFTQQLGSVHPLVILQ